MALTSHGRTFVICNSATSARRDSVNHQCWQAEERKRSVHTQPSRHRSLVLVRVTKTLCGEQNKTSFCCGCASLRCLPAATSNNDRTTKKAGPETRTGVLCCGVLLVGASNGKARQTKKNKTKTKTQEKENTKVAFAGCPLLPHTHNNNAQTGQSARVRESKRREGQNKTEKELLGRS